MSPPRVFHKDHLPVWNVGASSRSDLFLGQPPHAIPVKRGTVVFSYIIRSDGIPCDVTVKQGSWGAEVDRREIELLEKAVYFPAVKDNTPVAVRVDVPMTL